MKWLHTTVLVFPLRLTLASKEGLQRMSTRISLTNKAAFRAKLQSNTTYSNYRKLTLALSEIQDHNGPAMALLLQRFRKRCCQSGISSGHRFLMWRIARMALHLHLTSLQGFNRPMSKTHCQSYISTAQMKNNLSKKAGKICYLETRGSTL